MKRIALLVVAIAFTGVMGSTLAVSAPAAPNSNDEVIAMMQSAMRDVSQQMSNEFQLIQRGLTQEICRQNQTLFTNLSKFTAESVARESSNRVAADGLIEGKITSGFESLSNAVGTLRSEISFLQSRVQDLESPAAPLGSDAPRRVLLPEIVSFPNEIMPGTVHQNVWKLQDGARITTTVASNIIVRQEFEVDDVFGTNVAVSVTPQVLAPPEYISIALAPTNAQSTNAPAATAPQDPNPSVHVSAPKPPKMVGNVPIYQKETPAQEKAKHDPPQKQVWEWNTSTPESIALAQEKVRVRAMQEQVALAPSIFSGHAPVTAYANNYIDGPILKPVIYGSGAHTGYDDGYYADYFGHWVNPNNRFINIREPRMYGYPGGGGYGVSAGAGFYYSGGFGRGHDHNKTVVNRTVVNRTSHGGHGHSGRGNYLPRVPDNVYFGKNKPDPDVWGPSVKNAVHARDYPVRNHGGRGFGNNKHK
ncbi:MAG: hypothetical protein A2928_04085 [Candidatus Taylorbacteria bacterium RIFCSPLOWO2_01_FULL_45_15b]|uniref:DUF5666 domain-containing protein n=1 Tax=Candidatus Taylorbacteria bacterium RIFCSPLOWO2_01_FULL_45_15b TaxID=1802319 RepID=A0A1G2ND74_9BACT|nr:MAG: hypothetical protein A2928_04085 [Candidatus Taylorbacteria bacterium RIFCSPLOWO2_01_FULL_45_15b]